MIYIGIALMILVADLGIKYYIEHQRNEAQEDLILKNSVIVRKHHNKGIALNTLDKHPNVVKGLSLGMTILILVASLFSCFNLSKKNMEDSIGRKLGLTMVLGGALSNTYDRVFRGYVVDYFSFNVKWKKLSSVIFNIADLFIFIGSLMMSLFESKRK